MKISITVGAQTANPVELSVENTDPANVIKVAKELGFTNLGEIVRVNGQVAKANTVIGDGDKVEIGKETGRKG